MDESGGFFKVYRKAQQSAFWTKKPYVNYRGVWLTMLMMTNWKEGFFDGHTIKVGQFATSTESLSKACGLSIKQVRNVVDTMKEMGMVTVENVANRFSIVTICNWGTYNGEESRQGQTKGKLGADQGQTKGKLGATIEEAKNLRSEEVENNTPPNPQGGMGGDIQQELFQQPSKPESEKTTTKSKATMRVKENSPLMIRINSWFNMRHSTLWSVAEKEQLDNVNPSEEDLNLVEVYYTANLNNGERDIRRRDIKTLLNNWTGEVIRAGKFVPNQQRYTESGIAIPTSQSMRQEAQRRGTNRAEA